MKPSKPKRPDFVALIEDLRLSTRRPKDLTPDEQVRQVAIYAEKLDRLPDLAAAERVIRDWSNEFWPSWPELAQAIREARSEPQGAAGSTFFQRSEAVGFSIVALSVIGFHQYRRVEEEFLAGRLNDDELRAALRYCQETGETWRPSVARRSAA